DGHIASIEISDVTVENRVVTPVPGTGRTLPADLVLLAIGFDGTDSELVPLNSRGTVDCGPDWQTSRPGVFVAGDAHRRPSLIVWAIAGAPAAAAALPSYLGTPGSLPAPITPSSRALVAA